MEMEAFCLTHFRQSPCYTNLYSPSLLLSPNLF